VMRILKMTKMYKTDPRFFINARPPN